MNVNEYTERHYDQHKGDSDKIAQAYLEEALTLPDDDRYQALLPAIRSLASSTCSRWRKAQRGTPPAWAGSRPMTEASMGTGPPNQETEASDVTAVPPKNATETTDPTAGNPWLTYLTRQEHNNTLVNVPGAGLVLVLDATRPQLLLAQQAAADLAVGYHRTSEEYGRLVEKIDATPGATCLRDVLAAIRDA